MRFPTWSLCYQKQICRQHLVTEIFFASYQYLLHGSQPTQSHINWCLYSIFHKMDTTHLSEWAPNIVLFLFGSCLTQIDIYGYWKPFNTGMEYFIPGPILLGWKLELIFWLWCWMCLMEVKWKVLETDIIR